MNKFICVGDDFKNTLVAGGKKQVAEISLSYESTVSSPIGKASLCDDCARYFFELTKLMNKGACAILIIPDFILVIKILPDIISKEKSFLKVK